MPPIIAAGWILMATTDLDQAQVNRLTTGIEGKLRYEARIKQCRKAAPLKTNG